jgi:uncharacterized protein YbjT (DUF2867 family)
MKATSNAAPRDASAARVVQLFPDGPLGDPALSRSAVVAGGTGLVGGALLQLLGGDARYRSVTSLVRRETSAPPGVAVQRVDFEHLGELDLPNVDDAFCCLGTTRRVAGSAVAFRLVDLDYVVAFARVAKRAGALRFMLVSSLGASAGSPFLYPRTKGECEAAISAIGFTTVVILRPSFLIGARAQERPVEAVALRAGQLIRPLLIGPLRKYAPVDAVAVARTLARAAATAPAGITVIESDAIH